MLESSTAQDAPAPEFVRWWFAPWELGPAPDADLPGAPRDLLGRRDGYHRWCAQAGVPPGFPRGADGRWADLAWLADDELMTAARLFGGLFAVRTLQPQALAGLTPDERRWCASVASVQPLPRAPWHPATAQGVGLAPVGLAWLALCLDAEFPGLWARLGLRLDAPVRAAALRCLHEPGAPPPPAALARLARCWRMCVGRARAA